MAEKFTFRCIASQQADAATDIDVRHVTHMIIILDHFDDPTELRELTVDTTTMDWEAFFLSVRKFPDLRQIAVQCRRDYHPVSHLREVLVEFVAHMSRKELDIVDGLLGFYHDIREGQWNWAQIRLDDVIDDINLKV